MKICDFIIVSFKGIEYKININKLQDVLSFLENKKVVIKNNKQLSELLEKYSLYDKDFLERVNRI